MVTIYNVERYEKLLKIRPCDVVGFRRVTMFITQYDIL